MVITQLTRKVPSLLLVFVALALLMFVFTSGDGAAQQDVTELPVPGVLVSSWQPPEGQESYVLETNEIRGFPPYAQADTQALQSRAGELFWEAINQVPDTPGESTSVGHVLTVSGEGDSDYRWRGQQEFLRLAVGGGLNYDSSGNLRTSPSLIGVAAEADAASIQLAELPASVPTTQGLYVLNTPAIGRRTWVNAPLPTGEDGVARQGVAANEQLIGQLNADVDALEGEYLIEPDYWLRNASARTILVRLHTGGIPEGAARLRLVIEGQTLPVAIIRPGITEYAFSVTEIQATNVLNNLRSNPTVLANLTFLNGAGTSIEERSTRVRVVRDVPSTVHRFEETLSPSPAVLPAGTYEIVIRAYETGGAGRQDYEWRKLVSNLDTDQREYTSATDNPTTGADADAVYLTASYDSNTRTLTYSIGGTGVVLENIKAVGER